MKARKLRGFSQLRLAADTSNTRPLISMVESGRANLSVANLTAAAKALGVSVDFLCGLTTDPTPSRQLAKELADSATRVRDLEAQQAYVATADDGDYVGVSELAGAAGGGAVVDHDGSPAGSSSGASGSPGAGSPRATAASSRSSASRWNRLSSTGAPSL